MKPPSAVPRDWIGLFVSIQAVITAAMVVWTAVWLHDTAGAIWLGVAAGFPIAVHHLARRRRTEHTLAASEFFTAISGLAPGIPHRHADTATLLIRSRSGRLWWATDWLMVIAEADTDAVDELQEGQRIAVTWRCFWAVHAAPSHVYSHPDGDLVTRQDGNLTHLDLQPGNPTWQRMWAQARFARHLRAQPAEVRAIAAIATEADPLPPDAHSAPA